MREPAAMFTSKNNRKVENTFVKSEGRSQRGVTLLETLFALAIGGGLMVGGAYAVNERTEDIREKAAAEHLRVVSEAAVNYMRDNYGTALATPTRTYTPTDLAPYLPPNFNRNAYGETFRVVTRPNASGGIEAMVVTGSGPTTRRPDPKRISAAAALAGPTAAFFAQSSSTALQCGGAQVCGSFGAWNTNLTSASGTFSASGLTNPTLASLIQMQDGTVTNDFLYRNAIPGMPELNRMNTAIDMAGNNVNDAGAVTARQGVQTCTANATGCGVMVSDDGGFYDNNDAFITFRGTYAGGGVAITGPGNNLRVGGSVTVNTAGTLANNDNWMSLTNNNAGRGLQLTGAGNNLHAGGMVNAQQLGTYTSTGQKNVLQDYDNWLQLYNYTPGRGLLVRGPGAEIVADGNITAGSTVAAPTHTVVGPYGGSLTEMDGWMQLGSNRAGRGLLVRGAGNNIYADGAISSQSSISALGDVTAGNNISANGNVRASSMSVSSGTYTASMFESDGWMQLGSNRAARGLLLRGTGNNLYADGSIHSQAGITTGGAISASSNITAASFIPSQVVSVGGGCSSSGAMARLSNGTPAFCINGVWSSVSKTYTLASWRGPDGSGDIQAPSCPGGYTLLDWEAVSSYDNWTTVGLCER